MDVMATVFSTKHTYCKYGLSALFSCSRHVLIFACLGTVCYLARLSNTSGRHPISRRRCIRFSSRYWSASSSPFRFDLTSTSWATMHRLTCARTPSHPQITGMMFCISSHPSCLKCGHRPNLRIYGLAKQVLPPLPSFIVNNPGILIDSSTLQSQKSLSLVASTDSHTFPRFSVASDFSLNNSAI